jgi:arylsulfatase A-like enzyme
VEGEEGMSVNAARSVTVVVALLAASGGAEAAEEGTGRPNIVLIVADDLGFSDIGSYGSEIETPHIDRLAEDGLRFTQFYNMAKCETTRASLMTGLFAEKRHAEDARSIPGLLREAGYHTMIVGKEHFSRWVPEHVYARKSFDRSLVYWAINPYFIPPDGEWTHPFELDGREIAVEDQPFSRRPFYKTDALTDQALRFLDEAARSDRPFLLYLPYHVAHYPLQARQEDIARYRGRYLKGWDRVRAERFERMRALGVIPPQARLSPPEDNVNKYRGPFRGNVYHYRPWESLEDEEREALDLEMAVFAAMVHRLDQNVGRILEKLDERGLEESTLVIFLSDNGSCPYDSNRDFSIPPGGPASYRTLSAAWANVGNTPWRFYKQYGHEGGGHTHLIARWPGVVRPGFCRVPAHVVDLLPTLVDVAGTAYPESVDDRPTPALDGSSLVPLLRGRTRPDPGILISGFTERFRMVRVGNRKIVRVNAGPWELYDLSKDPTELEDLARERPDELAELVAAYHRWIRDHEAVMPLLEEVEGPSEPSS